MNDPNNPAPGRAASPSQAGTSGSPGDGATGVLDDLEQLRQRAETAERDRDQFRALVQQTRADFENYQKRVQRDLQQERRYAQTPLARDLLPALDNLERATLAAKQSNESGPLVQGVVMVQTQILDVLRRHGITPIEALGQPFDPNLHQAVMQEATTGVPPNTVLRVLERGFMIHDRVLRPAQVVVSRTGE